MPQQLLSLSATRVRLALSELVRSGLLELPLLPQSATQVLAECNSSACDARRLAELLQRDQALAAHVLHIANSAAYAARESIVSLQQAVGRLGMRTLCDITLAVALKQRVFQGPVDAERLRQLWRHSAAAGAWAREIARARRKNVEGAFLCGLLHDIGKPVVLQAACDLASSSKLELSAMELDALIDELHCELGATLLESWKMPEWMCVALRWHHAPESAPHFQDEARMAALADLLAHWTTDPTEQRLTELCAHPLLEELNLYQEDFGELLARRELVERVMEAFA